MGHLGTGRTVPRMALSSTCVVGPPDKEQQTGRQSSLLSASGAHGAPRARALEAAGYAGLVAEERTRLVLHTDKP